MRLTRSVLTLVMFATVSISAVTQSTAPDTVDEPRSGTPFPLSLTPPGGTTPHWLMGTAIRQRTLFRVQIYAFGLYVDPEGARASLSRFAGVSAPRLEDDESFYRHLLDLDFDMTLRLVMTRTVDGDDVAEAFDEALRPRLVRAVTDTIGADELAALDRFRSYFDVDEVRTGTEVVFSCGPAGRLATSVGGDERPPINSRACAGLCLTSISVRIRSRMTGRGVWSPDFRACWGERQRSRRGHPSTHRDPRSSCPKDLPAPVDAVSPASYHRVPAFLTEVSGPVCHRGDVTHSRRRDHLELIMGLGIAAVPHGLPVVVPGLGGGADEPSARCGGGSPDSGGGSRVLVRACGDGCVDGSAPRRGPRVPNDRRCRTSRRTPTRRRRSHPAAF